MKKVMFLYCILFSTSGFFSQLCFEPFLAYAAGTGVGGITTADFNGDGILDLVAGNDTGFSILLGAARLIRFDD